MDIVDGIVGASDSSSGACDMRDEVPTKIIAHDGISPPDLTALDTNLDSSDTGDDDPPDSNKRRRKEKFYTCRNCLRAHAKYICPACFTRLCSAICSQDHKEKDKCSGLRNRITSWKSKDQVSESHLREDLKILNEIGEEIESAARLDSAISLDKHGQGDNSIKHVFSKMGSVPNKYMTKLARLKILESGVVWRQSPSCSERKRRNTTTLTTGRNRRVRWRVEWRIMLEDGRVKNVEHRGHSEICVLRDLINNTLSQEGIELGDEPVPLVVDESVPSNQRGYIILDSSRTLRSCIRGLVIIDFPTIIVIPQALLTNACESQPYSLDSTTLPHWAVGVMTVRQAHVATYNGKPVYSKSYEDGESETPDVVDATAGTVRTPKLSDGISEISSEDDEDDTTMLINPPTNGKDDEQEATIRALLLRPTAREQLVRVLEPSGRRTIDNGDTAVIDAEEELLDL